MDETRADLMAERRAKLARLRGELNVLDNDITSAPSLTLVDEFQERFNAADARSGLVEHAKQADGQTHKIFYAQSNKKSDLDNNNLVAEASRRGGRDTEEAGLEEEADSVQLALGNFKEDEATQDRSPANLDSLTTKVYQNGKYINSSEDLGYQSSASSPNEKKRKTEASPENGLLKVERGVDTFSQSLPETFLKRVKSDLSHSVRLGEERTRSKVMYDPRMFEGTASAKEGPASLNEDPVEREYFERMSKLNGKVKKTSRSASFRQFLSQSFKEETGNKTVPVNKETLQTRRAPLSLSPRQQTLNLAPLAEGRGVKGEPSPLECIDLGDPAYSSSRSRSPTLSCQTEFTEPDRRGRSRRKQSSQGFSSFALKLQGLGRGVIGLKDFRKRPDLEPMHEYPAGTEFGESWGYPPPRSCEPCNHRRTNTCYGVLALLAIDIFTIILIIILFNKIYQCEDFGIVEARQGLQPVPESSNINLTLPEFAEEEERSISPRSLEPRLVQDQSELDELRERLDNLTNLINSIKNPPTFSCYRTSHHAAPLAVVVYEACSLQTPGMEAKTGRFTAQEDGVYQFTFTALFAALRGHMLSADIYLARPGGKPEVLTRSSAMVREDTVFGISRDDDLFTTTSNFVLHRLYRGDQVYVSMVVDGSNGDSVLQSDSSKKIHFTGLKVSK